MRYSRSGRLIYAVLLLFLLLRPAIGAAHKATPDFFRFDQRARSGSSLNIVFLGGSLTWGAQATDPQLTSYRAQIARKLEAQYPSARFHFWDAAIGGTGSQLGVFRLDRDVLSRQPDLVFLDFTVNDGPYSIDEDKLAAYEAIIRKLLQAGIPVVQALFATKKDVLPSPPFRPLDEKHTAMADAYGVPSGNALRLMRERIAKGEARPDDLWPIPDDDIHPGDAGYALFAEAVWQAFSDAVRQKTVSRLPADMLHADTYMTANRLRLSEIVPLPPGWTPGTPHRSAVAYDFVMSRWLDEIVIASRKGDAAPGPLRLTVRAQNIMLFGEVTPSTGKFSVTIDGGSPRVWDPKPAELSGNMRYVGMIAQGLDAGKSHVLEITPILKAGEELRIESLCLAGAPATLSHGLSATQ